MADMAITEAGGAGITETKNPPPSVLNTIRADFPEPPPTQTAPEVEAPPAPPEPKKYAREIDLGDGSGVQKFEAESYEALVDKLADAQKHATLKIRELSKEVKLSRPIEPEKQLKYEELKGKELSPAELIAIKEGWNADPVAAFAKLFESQTGITPEQYRSEENQRRQRLAVQEAEREFVTKHKDDFVANRENSEKIYSLLRKEELPITKKNLEWAFNALKEEVGPPRTLLPPPPPPPVVESGPKPVPPPPVSIPANFGARVEPQAQGEIPASEYARIAALPPADMKAAIQSLWSQGKIR